MVRIVAALLVVTFASIAGAQTRYYPERLDWQRRTPEQTGMSAAALDAAVTFAIANENPAPKDLALARATSGANEPFDTPIGPLKARSATNGLIIKNGYVVAEWGDTKAVDMTFSVTKTFLSTVFGLAWHQGLIRNVTDRAGDYMPPGVDLFDDPHNQAITWEHLLRQTSDWKGTLWGKPDWADRPEGKPEEWPNRKLNEPGTRYKYNDVRVNVLALALLHVLRRPLPEVLREQVMEPIGASSTWRWHGYESSWIELDGRKVQSMTGGGHWGGGMFINAWDLARFGYLFLRSGKWKDQQIVPEKWIEMARTPGPANNTYGYMNWFLNTGKKPLPSVPESSVTFRGNGQNIIYLDWQNDLVVVVRWIDNGSPLNEFLGKVVGAMRPASTQ